MANLNGQQTLSNIQDQIGSVLFNQSSLSSSTYPNTTMVNASINKFYKRFYSMFPFVWDKLDSVSVNTGGAGVKNVVMPDTCMKVTNMVIESLVRKLIHYPRE